MQPQVAEFLCCPDCSSPLRLQISAQAGNEITSGAFHCSKCRKEFPIRDGIPRFAPMDTYVSSFGFEWKQWRRTQFDTPSRKTSESTFLASTGTPCQNLAGKLVLDAGCGAGRYMDLVARAGARVFGVDMSLAVEVAQENLGHLPNCSFLQADLLHLPFRPGQFDFVYSLGVLHHTPNAREAFLSLTRTLGPGGEISIWVYPRHRLADTFQYFPAQVNEVLAQDVNFRIPPNWQGIVRRFAKPLDWTMETCSRFQRAFTTRLPPRWLYWLCHAAIPLYYLYRIPLFYPMRLMTKIAMHPEPEWRVLDTFDWYSARFQWKHTYPEIRAWFEEAKLEEITILPRPVAARGKKPVR